MDQIQLNWPGLLGALAAIALALGILAGAAEAATGGASPTESASPPAVASEPESEPASSPSAGSISVLSAHLSPRKAFYYGVREPRLSFVISSTQPENDLRIDIVDAAGGIVRTLYRNDVAPNTTTTVGWDGSSGEGRPAANGRYTFRISPQGAATTSRVAARAAEGTLELALYRYIFPIQGEHSYGDGIGAQRVGHTHQGQDLPAACGTPVVAVRGGRVQFSGYQAGGAGYYAVIDGRGTGQDTAYLHMLKPAALPTGSAIRTGQIIGYVGNTGDSQGCHLHFELWSAPGWFEGGQFMDPTAFLERIDRYS